MNRATSFPREKIHVVLLEGVADTAVETFKRAGYSKLTVLSGALSGAELVAAIADAHIVGIRSRTQLTAEVLAAAPKLMAIGAFCIGTNQIDLSAAARRGIAVFNAPHSNTRSVAELVIAEAVMLLRGIPDKSVAAHQGKWLKTATNSHELRGRTIGIVGYGHIGSQVSVLAESFGMSVVYYDTITKLPLGNSKQLASLDELLGVADIVTLHVPQAPDTNNLLNAARIQKLKRGAVLLNLSRGNVVDLEALGAALKSGAVLGAAVDVFPVEPETNKDQFVSPLQGLSNVILTPHIGGSTEEAQRNIGVEVADKLIQYSDMGRTIGSVNFPELSLPIHDGAHRLLHVHHNVPGVLSSVNRIQAEANVNIVGQYLQTRGEIGYVVMDLESNGDDLQKELLNLEHTIRCRLLF
ncbi:MAG: phosphoglycerate dehydrogenase [Deltaproteobacteria bacterium]|nr:phosphoglycerate dehydrogenase [Deltaproteobacteria bacterium]